jgi:4-hydroxy-tetrahydrodipicolinate synthase
MRPPLQGLNATEKAELEQVIGTLKAAVNDITKGD